MSRTSLVLVLLLAACDSGGGSAGAGGATGGAGGSGGSGGGTGGSGGGGGQTVTLTMGPFQVPPAMEVYKCQDFRNPFGGVDTDIKTYESHMSPGSHHLFLFFYDVAADGPLVDCPSGGLEFHPYPYATQSPDGSMTYPDGVGSLVQGSKGFRLNAHYVNTTSSPFMATVTAILHVAPPGSVSQHAGTIFFNNLLINIPPDGIAHEVTDSCPIPSNVKLLAATSHMHKHATHFTAAAGSTAIYETTQWADPPPRSFNPPLDLGAGSRVTWTCTYVNDTCQTGTCMNLTFGESAVNNVMCIFTGLYYPVASVQTPIISCF